LRQQAGRQADRQTGRQTVMLGLRLVSVWADLQQLGLRLVSVWADLQQGDRTGRQNHAGARHIGWWMSCSNIAGC
jgi:hypothetical protein